MEEYSLSKGGLEVGNTTYLYKKSALYDFKFKQLSNADWLYGEWVPSQERYSIFGLKLWRKYEFKLESNNQTMLISSRNEVRIDGIDVGRVLDEVHSDGCTSEQSTALWFRREGRGGEFSCPGSIENFDFIAGLVLYYWCSNVVGDSWRD